MRHWLWYKTDGEIGGELVYDGGWDTGVDFNNAGETDPDAVALKDDVGLPGGVNGYTNMPGFAGFISYDCACAASVRFCQHATEQVAQKKVSGGSLVARPLPKIMVDSVEVSHDDLLDKTPGASVSVQLQEVVADDMADGVKYDAANKGDNDVLQSSPQVMTYTSGVTNTVTATAPAQGAVGTLNLIPQNSIDGRSVRIRIRGWA